MLTNLGKWSFFGEKLTLLGVYYHFKLASVHCDKSTKKILAGVRPPLPLLGNARIFTASVTATPPLVRIQLGIFSLSDIRHALDSSKMVHTVTVGILQIIQRLYFTWSWVWVGHMTH